MRWITSDTDLPYAAGAVLEDKSLHEIASMGAVTPYILNNVQPSSIDLRLGDTFRVYDPHKHSYVDLNEGPPDNLTRLVKIEPGEPFVIHPGEFVLGNTLEEVQVPDDLVARLEGKSSLGRLGLIIHATAGYIDPGFIGTITLEMLSIAPIPMRVYIGNLIAQLSFMRLVRPAQSSYDGRYQGDKIATESRYGASRLEPMVDIFTDDPVG